MYGYGTDGYKLTINSSSRLILVLILLCNIFSRRYSRIRVLGPRSGLGCHNPVLPTMGLRVWGCVVAVIAATHLPSPTRAQRTFGSPNNTEDGCSDNVCENGLCYDSPAGYSCYCEVGWVGQHCNQDFDECLATPCLNDGVCSTPSFGGFECACVGQWNGTFCDNLVVTENCTGYGNWTQGFGTAPWGRTLGTCMINENCTWAIPERPAPGINAVFDSDNVTCDSNCLMPDGYMCGDNEFDDCEAGPCQNGASCRDFAGYYTCFCTDGWDGEDCDVPADLCMLSPCENGGTCNPADGLCTCPVGFEGETCSAPDDYVASLRTVITVPADLPLSYIGCVDLCVGALHGHAYNR